jgi:toxin ParE1/3/4
MSARIVVSPRADDDVLGIIDYYTFEVGNERIANRFVDALKRTYAGAAKHPGMGSPRWQWTSPRLAGVRSCLIQEFPSYLVFYRPTEGMIEVIRVLHGARDIVTALLADE